MPGDEKPREACGIVGVFNHPEAAKLAYLALYQLQHRGQESAGIVAADGSRLRPHRGDGLVAEVFSASVLENLPGHAAIGHVRYSTTGSTLPENAQPLLANYHGGSVAVAHNGNLTNAAELRAEFERRGSIFQTSTDSEILLHLIAHASTSDFNEALMQALMQIKGAYSLVFLTPHSLAAVRDPRGFRPLSLGKLGTDSYVVASETCAMDLIGATYLRDVQPGEILSFDHNGFHTHTPFARAEPSFCVFENIYFSRPDSIACGRSIYEIRVDLGRELAIEQPVKADVVISVPDSATPAAIGFAQESGLPFEMGLIRNHYIGRTFIEPRQHIRDFGAKIKYNTVRGVLEGKRVVVVDDSIVRGTTSRKIVKMIRDAGAAEVHVRSSAPPLSCPCFFGVDIPSPEELIASRLSVDEIRKQIRADSLGYLSIKGLAKVMPKGTAYCTGCFDGNYPLAVPVKFGKEILEVK